MATVDPVTIDTKRHYSELDEEVEKEVEFTACHAERMKQLNSADLNDGDKCEIIYNMLGILECKEDEITKVMIIENSIKRRQELGKIVDKCIVESKKDLANSWCGE